MIRIMTNTILTMMRKRAIKQSVIEYGGGLTKKQQQTELRSAAVSVRLYKRLFSGCGWPWVKDDKEFAVFNCLFISFGLFIGQADIRKGAE